MDTIRKSRKYIVNILLSLALCVIFVILIRTMKEKVKYQDMYEEIANHIENTSQTDQNSVNREEYRKSLENMAKNKGKSVSAQNIKVKAKNLMKNQK